MTIRWGEHGFEPEEQRQFQLGNLEVSITRSALEWFTEYTYQQDRYVSESRKSTTTIRTIDQSTNNKIQFKPATANRNVVVRPMHTVNIPPGQAAHLFIGTPLWMQCVIESNQATLFDLPVEILSDTWFGTNTRSGEICYANQTRARMLLEQLSGRPERLITPLTIRNEGEQPLVIERLNLPMPLLSIYDTGVSLWTQKIEIQHISDLAHADIVLAEEPPSEFPNAELLAEARSVDQGSLIQWTIDRLFDHRRSL